MMKNYSETARKNELQLIEGQAKRMEVEDPPKKRFCVVDEFHRLPGGELPTGLTEIRHHFLSRNGK